MARSTRTPPAMACKWDEYAVVVRDFLSDLYDVMSANYVAIATIFFVVLITFFLPDITHRFQATNELKDMKKVFDKMSEKVKQAEVACLTVADKICCLHCSMHDDTTETSNEVRDLSVCTSHCVRSTHSEPVQIEKKVGLFRKIFFPRGNISHKEITIMSYVYTDSFDAKKPVIISSQ
ncbi:uncharacterized protein LOC142974908 [Anticarsia gemmatalis]|uniref:uncharacterized protein LOC142974908 n=1 Tax=Anticarsia gemmatalis TaxID=129554 RepID=UPI003F764BBE